MTRTQKTARKHTAHFAHTDNNYWISHFITRSINTFIVQTAARISGILNITKTTLNLSTPNSDRDRKIQCQNWLSSLSDYAFSEIEPASADASFRRYFRTTDENSNKTYIVMDAPPDKEDCGPFIQVTQILRNAGINAPEILAQNLEQGFLLLSDLGDQPYLNHLNDRYASTLYIDALSSIVRMQNIKDEVMANLPAYDEQRLRDEMELFESWYLNKHLDIQLDAEQKAVLENTFDLLIQNALEQPQVFVHRDFHSRNLMVTQNDNPGVIDYQDAVVGPLTYDLVSLLKDCYIEWPREQVEQWLEDYSLKSEIIHKQKIELDKLMKWFDLMGVQRHLKVLGIFARLNYRDGKAQYLNDLPLTLKYVVDACERYEELKQLQKLLEQIVLCHSKVSLS